MKNELEQLRQRIAELEVVCTQMYNALHDETNRTVLHEIWYRSLHELLYGEREK